MNTKKNTNLKTYNREQYHKTFFPSSEAKETLETYTPYNLGIKLANDAVNQLKEALRKPKTEEGNDGPSSL